MMTNYKLFNCLIMLLSLTLLSACANTAYTRHKTPNIAGSIVIDGEPVESIMIYLSIKASDNSCQSVAAKTSTGPDGKFHMSSLKEQMSYTPVMTHYLDDWNLCAEIRQQRIPLYSDNHYGIGSVQQSVTINCTFTAGQYRKQSCTQLK